MTIRDPLLHPVPIADLRPTQITVGMREVEAKRRAWAAKSADKGATFLGTHMVPVIVGPKGRNYVIDHHHLCRALLEEGQDTVAVTVVADLQRLEPDSFWFMMDNRGWMHPFDENGVRQGYDAIPKAMADLKDDPFRSLAGELRLAGGYAKDTTPFSEFLWADFLRHRLKARAVSTDFDTALATALNMAKSGDADHLPGWCGAVAR